jgi:uncharacterized protein
MILFQTCCEYGSTMMLQKKFVTFLFEENTMARIDMDTNQMAGFVPSSASAETFYELGLLYAAGRSVPHDLVTAHKWLSIAVLRGSRPAVELRAELTQEMSAQDIAAAQREARLWLTRH